MKKQELMQEFNTSHKFKISMKIALFIFLVLGATVGVISYFAPNSENVLRSSNGLLVGGGGADIIGDTFINGGFSVGFNSSLSSFAVEPGVNGAVTVKGGGLSVQSGGLFVADVGATVATGGLAVMEGGLYIGADGVSIASGGLSVGDGGVSVEFGGLYVATEGATVALGGLSVGLRPKHRRLGSDEISSSAGLYVASGGACRTVRFF